MSSSLREFLRTAKQQLRDSQMNKTPITLVMGNEKADIDTIASTLIFAYLRSSAPPQGAFSQYYIPLIQAERQRLHEITHLSKLLPHLGLELSDLLVLDDMSLEGTQSHLSIETTRFFLINWNLLVGRQGENYARNIAGCIDHHRDENYVPRNTEPEPRIIGEAGSCTSLVVNAMREPWQRVGGENESDRRQWNQHLAALGLAGVLIETHDLKRGLTREDENAYEFLAGMYGGGLDHTRFYNDLLGREEFVDAAPAPPVQEVTYQPPAQPIDAGDIGVGTTHRTFTGNRLDPRATETVQTFHEEVLPEHVHGSTGQHLTGTTIGEPGIQGGYSSSGAYGQTGASTAGVSGYGAGAGASAGYGDAGYATGANTGAGYTSGATTGGLSSGANYGSTGSYGQTGASRYGAGATGGLGSDATYGSTGSYGQTGVSGSGAGYGSTGVADQAYASGAGYSQSSGAGYDNSSAGYDRSSAGYGSSSATGQTSGAGYDSSRSRYDNSSSGYGAGSNTGASTSGFGSNLPNRDPHLYGSESNTGSGSYSQNNNNNQALDSGVEYGGQRGGTGNGAAVDTTVDSSKTQY